MSSAADHGPTCAETPFDHRCGDTEGDQGETWEEHATRQAWRQAELADALLRAVMYLDGFVWVSEPEASELDHIKSVVVSALGTMAGVKTWEQVVELAELRDARRGGAETAEATP